MSIAISAGVRNALSSLQSTAEMMGITNQHLATGRKVNSASDNASAYFTAQSLNNRASDISNLLDDMGQAVQVLKAADQGITSISKLVDAAKAKANQALQTSDSSSRTKYAAEYGELLNQIASAAKDASYNGKNLLGGTGNDLSVLFNETSTSKLKVTAVDYTDASNIGLDSTIYSGSGTTFGADTAETTDAGSADGDYLEFAVTTSSGSTTYKVNLTDADTIKDVVDKVNNATNGEVQASYDETSGQISYASANNFTVAHNDSSDGAVSGSKLTVTAASAAVNFGTDAQINAVLKALNSAQSTLRAQSSTFGTSLSTVQTRQDFAKNIINTLQAGADKLTLADTNEEGANLLALQTQQALSTKALSLSAQAGQQVLQLLG
ncbi:flagellin N-terminal helical domain-containing protein [Pinisolibacter sp.]|uniref:flagellin N-terminal helical domain-containing protein n=1 Tax=Pinisolibacter sp. TaxID=2172024 RepID=UPI002FDCFA41